MRLQQLPALVLGMCFIVLAALQYNRPDAVLWIAVFLLTAMFSIMAALGKMNRLLLSLAGIAYCAAAVYFWLALPALSDLQANTGTVQGVAIPDYVSLALAGLGMFACALLSKRKERLHPPHVPGKIKNWAN